MLKTAEHTCFQERRRVETCVLEEDMCAGFGEKMLRITQLVLKLHDV